MSNTDLGSVKVNNKNEEATSYLLKDLYSNSWNQADVVKTLKKNLRKLMIEY